RGDRAGPWGGAATDERPSRDRVVRRAKRAPSARAAVLAADPRDPGDLKDFVRAQGRQQRRQALKRQRLATAGRSDQQKAVRAGRRDLEAAPEDRVTAEVGQVEQLPVRLVLRLDPR